MRRHITRIAEQVFWDTQAEALASADPAAAGAATAGVAGLLAELGADLLEMLSQQVKLQGFRMWS